MVVRREGHLIVGAALPSAVSATMLVAFSWLAPSRLFQFACATSGGGGDIRRLHFTLAGRIRAEVQADAIGSSGGSAAKRMSIKQATVKGWIEFISLTT